VAVASFIGPQLAAKHPVDKTIGTNPCWRLDKVGMEAAVKYCTGPVALQLRMTQGM
jgi:hypothetical protein